MNPADLLFRLGLALAVGLLVGTERHWRERAGPPGSRTAGIRTFGVTGLLGGSTAAVAQQLGSGDVGIVLISLVFVAYSAVFAAFKWREAAEQHEFSVTAVIVGQVTLLLGAMAVVGDVTITAALAILLTLLLASRELLHGLIAKIEWRELRSAILLLAMAFVVLPLLPDRHIGPLDAINPREIWIFAIVLAAVSYTGYISVKIFGNKRGPVIAGFAGGLASSTAVALTSARQSVGNENIEVIAAGALAASAVSALRAIGLLAVLIPAAMANLAPVFGLAAAVLGVAAIYLSTRDSIASSTATTETRNPFRLSSVLQLAAVLAIAMFIARAATELLGGSGTLIASGAMGLVDIDAVIISLSRLNDTPGPGSTLLFAVLLAFAANMVGKAGLSILLGSRQYGLLIGAATALALLTSAALAALILA
ncbi:MgtC/SapB family protein [Rhodoligotrophos ferricapiens]|uniref:MgtC/SapB family protein n=1 Tax=Rhodoligotrophos ferricapiens TaxID=3069264 RepID=UPI00315DF028